MANEGIPGILLRGADGTECFVPATDLSAFRVTDASGELPAGAEHLRVEAYAVARDVEQSGTASAFIVAMPEAGGDSAAAFVAMTESSASSMPMPEGGGPEAVGEA